MAKHVDKLGPFETFTAPWETATGETEIDNSKLKRHLYNLMLDKAKAQDARDESQSKLTEVEQERDGLKAEAEKGGNPDLVKELEAERSKTAAEVARADKAERDLLVTTVAVDKGIPVKQALKRLQGTTEDEIVADADEFLADFGPGGSDDGDDDTLTSFPRDLNNPGSGAKKKTGSVSTDDFEAVAAGLRSKRIF